GTITGTGEFKDTLYDNSNGNVITGSAISLIGNKNYQGNISLVINGSKINLISNKGYAVLQSVTNVSNQIKSIMLENGIYKGAKGALLFSNYTDIKDKVAITGGSYSSNPKEYVNSGYAVAKRGDMFVVEIPAPAPTSPDLPADKPKEVQPVTPVVTSVDIEAAPEVKAKAVS
ncbi:MAG: hypothetical protein RR340_12115, partial [Cloacibacillus sp.]